MKDFIEALTILSKYNNGDKHSPSHCEHDQFMIFVDNPVSDEDLKRLDELGFHPGTEWGEGEESRTEFTSFRFGSC